VVDVVGILDSLLGSRDASGKLVNDPWPTPFENCGFDLDGVGVIHHSPLNTHVPEDENPFRVYPVPCHDVMFLEDSEGVFKHWALYDIHGRMIMQGKMNKRINSINLAGIPDGIYFLNCAGEQQCFVERILKQ